MVDIPPYPYDSEEDVCRNTTFMVSFSESLDPASPDDENFWLYYADGDDPSDELDVSTIRSLSIGGESDDTLSTGPEDLMEEYTDYGINLYSGDAATDTFEGAIYDTCGNPLSGDFDDEMEGHPTDDFVETTSAGLDQAFCYCIDGVQTCNVDVGSSTCVLDDLTTCDLGTTCDSSHEDYTGYEYQYTFTTGDKTKCEPDIDSIAQEDNYYSEDEDPYGETDSSDTGKVMITGSYIYPFTDLGFYKNVTAAGSNCFDTNYDPTMSCFISYIRTTNVTVRTPVGSQTGRVWVENNDGDDTSADVATIDSPFINYTSPSSGPAGQYVTIKGKNFIDYDPDDATTYRGTVYFDDTEAQVMCEDGWDDDEIIVQVPDGFEADVDVPNIQVVTADYSGEDPLMFPRHSNQKAFTITSGNPGPGLCELDPDCSDTGEDDVYAYGENFGDSGTMYFDPPEEGYFEVDSMQEWGAFDGARYYALTNGIPVSDINTYDVTAANAEGISNGLDFNITCTDPPEVFEYNQCDLDIDTWYLPNPRPYEDEACVNSIIMAAFTNDMANATVTANADIKQCNYGYDGDEQLEFDSSTCSVAVSGSYTVEYLSDAFLGGDGTGDLDGTTDVDGDGYNDAYEAYTFEPTDGFTAGYYYQITLPTTITNEDGVQLLEEYTWYFRVRDDEADCVADYLSLRPYSQIENEYEYGNACLKNYEYDADDDGSDEDYTFKANPATSDCLLLDPSGNYNWEIADESKDVLEFGDEANPEQGETSSTTVGYNMVCKQGDQSDNEGEAWVTAQILNPNDLTEVSAEDSAVVTVDFGYCTQDSDCYTNECTDTYCDPSTSHCAPDITSFSPNNDTPPDVGPGGCVTLNGCYFGTDRVAEEVCTCTSLLNSQECDVDLGANTCLLPDKRNYCSLGEKECDLGLSCESSLGSAFFADDGGLEGCTCEIDGQECDVEPDEQTCIAPGTDTCDAADATYVEPYEGAVLFETTDAEYPSEVYCDDTWDNTQVIAQVPETGMASGDYTITLKSHYYSDVDGEYLQDTYDEEDCVVGSDQTPCLCKVDPDSAQENWTTDLFGEGFSLLTADGGEEVSFGASPYPNRLEADGSETWTSDNEIEEVVVPEGAIGDSDDPGNDGVQVQSDSLVSNAISFIVECNSNWDCATGCCSDYQCADPEVCNACEDNADCTYGDCLSECVNGMCAPYITGLSPNTGAVGQPVTVQGCHFGAYYDDSYPNESTVEVDDIEAPLACSETDSWNNQEIIITMPDNIFPDTDETAYVEVNQVYDSGNSTQASNTSEFTKDESCSEVDIPVLCDATPAYSPYNTATDTVKLEGENFYGEAEGYCSCDTDYFGPCEVTLGDTSCTITETTTYYVNPDDTSEPCSDGSVADYPSETSNSYTLYSAIDGYCTYTDPTDATTTCTISVGDASCDISESQTCYANEDESACAEDSSSFISLDGSVDYFSEIEAVIDWAQHTSEMYYTDVPEGSETGDVHAIATTSDDLQCTSNGLEYPITCSQCSDCVTTSESMHCNLNYDASFGACTTETEDFCRTATNSCCGMTSCVYDASTAEADDMGTCSAQPYILFDDADNELYYDTNPEEADTNVCPNAEFMLEFNSAVTTQNAFYYNNNEDTSDDVSSDSINYSDYIYLRPATVADTATTTELSTVTVGADGRTLTLTQEAMLDFDTLYELIVVADEDIAATEDAASGIGTNHQEGIVNTDSGAAAYCTDDQADAGMCDTDGIIKITFRTVSPANFEAMCGPSYIDLDATSDEFIEVNYTFNEEEQEEEFEATVYANGEDETAATEDDQAIIPIADEMYWEYTWDTKYETIEDLSASSCPVAGIITGGNEGTCSCSYTDSCTMNTGDRSCNTDTDGIVCMTDSPSEVCNSLDSTYDSSTGTCTCTITDSCTMDLDDAYCELDYEDDGRFSKWLL